MLTRPARVLVAGSALALLVGCAGGGKGGTGHQQPLSPATPPMPAGASTLVIDSDGVHRSFTIVRPRTGAHSEPLVVFLHGARAPEFGESVHRALRFDTAAADNGILTVYPDGDSETHSWRAGCCSDVASDPADVNFVTNLIDYLVNDGEADPQHVVIAGFSSGALLANTLGCRLADRISGVLSIAGTLLSPPSFVTQVGASKVPTCTPARPVTVLLLGSSDDTVVPVAGSTSACKEDPCGPGSLGYLAPAVTVAGWWRQLDGCDPPTTSTQGTATVTLAGCKDGTVVGQAVVSGPRHNLGEYAAAFDVRSTLVDLALGRPLSTW